MRFIHHQETLQAPHQFLQSIVQVLAHRPTGSALRVLREGPGELLVPSGRQSMAAITWL